jgi:hypothetical protein
MAVFPSPDNATDDPSPEAPTPPMAASLLPCWVHTPPLRVNTHAAPKPELSFGPPRTAVLPSADNATDVPSPEAPVPSLATSLLPCCVHTPPLRVYTHAAPVPGPTALPSCGPPTIAVLPSADTATDVPCWGVPTPPAPTSGGPRWTNWASAMDDERSSVAAINAVALKTLAARSARDIPTCAIVGLHGCPSRSYDSGPIRIRPAEVSSIEKDQSLSHRPVSSAAGKLWRNVAIWRVAARAFCRKSATDFGRLGQRVDRLPKEWPTASLPITFARTGNPSREINLLTDSFATPPCGACVSTG